METATPDRLSWQHANLPRNKGVQKPVRETAMLGRFDWACMAAALLLSAVICCVFSRGRILWEDELLGWMLLRDPSLRHMVWAWKMGADGGGFGFYATGRIWFWLFGPSALSLRMYSAMSLGAAFCVVWIIARHFYSRAIVFFALFNTWFCSLWLVVHMAEGRFYGLLTLATACAAWMSMIGTRRTGRLPAYWYVSTFAVHAMLVTSHVLGIVYSGFMLAILVALDRMEGRWRPLLYCCASAAWLLLIPESAAIHASAMVGKPHFWTAQPSLITFIGAYVGFSSEVALVLLLLASLIALTMWQKRNPESVRRAFRDRKPVWVASTALLLVPIAFLLEGLAGPAIFVNRYLMPVVIAQVFVTAEACCFVNWSMVLPRTLRGRKWTRGMAASVFVGILFVWIFGHTRFWVMAPVDYTDQLTAMLPKQVPVVCEDAWSFAEIMGRQHGSGVGYTYLLDWPQAIDPQAPRLEVTQYHLMENWRKVGFFSGSIIDRSEFLQKNTQFLVLRMVPHPEVLGRMLYGNPLIDRFKSSPGYEVRPYTVLKRDGMWDEVWMVCRESCETQSRIAR